MATLPPHIKVADAYVRKLSEDHLLIESTCKFCGAVIVGRATDNELQNREKRHLEICTRLPRD